MLDRAPNRPDEPEEAVGPLMRGLAVLRALTDAGRPCTPPELAAQVGLARASLDRILATLVELDFVRVDGRQVTLAPPVMRLGNAYLHALRIPALLGPIAERLSDELDEIVTLTVADDDGVHVVHESVRPRRLVIACRVGDRLPLDRCAVGAVYARHGTLCGGRGSGPVTSVRSRPPGVPTTCSRGHDRPVRGGRWTISGWSRVWSPSRFRCTLRTAHGCAPSTC